MDKKIIIVLFVLLILNFVYTAYVHYRLVQVDQRLYDVTQVFYDWLVVIDDFLKARFP